MKIGLMRAAFYLRGCRSLKDKRRRLAGLRDRFGKQTGMAVCESNYADSHERAEWSFIACGGSLDVVQQALSDVERYLTTSLDAEVLDLQREWLV